MDDGTESVPGYTNDALGTASLHPAIREWLKSFGSLTPYAVPVKLAQELLGNKSRAEVYAALGRDELRSVKNGTKTLIVVASIVRYCASMKPAKIAPPPKKKWPAKSALRRSRKASLRTQGGHLDAP
jgi:hypothetical protein